MCVPAFNGDNVIYSATTGNTAVDVLAMYYNPSDVSCSGSILSTNSTSYPNTCASISTSLPAGSYVTLYSDGSCANPVFQAEQIDGVCYANADGSSTRELSCDPTTGVIIIISYFTNPDCTGPFYFQPDFPLTGCLPADYLHSTTSVNIKCIASPATSITSSPTSPLPAGDEVLCYQATLTEYTFASERQPPLDTELFGGNGVYVAASGTGNATMEVFFASNQIEVNVTFAGLSSQTSPFASPFPSESHAVTLTLQVP